MTPGIPSEDEITAERKPNSQSHSQQLTIRPSASSLTSLQEKWDDIRDALTETDAYVSLSRRSSAACDAANSVWTFSKRVAWVLGTSALVLVIPLLYEIDKELGPGFDSPTPTSASSSSPTPDSASSAASSAAPADTAGAEPSLTTPTSASAAT